LVSFGGPDRPEDVMPFLETVTRGRNIPRERLSEVAEHYYHFGGKSPINEQNRALIEALREELDRQQLDLPIYWGNRNWDPLIPATLTQMKQDGVKRALAIFTSAFSSYSGCRQYRENIAAARSEVGPDAPEVDKVRAFYNCSGFLSPQADSIRAAWSTSDPASTRLLITAHSIPMSMSDNCRYLEQLKESCRLLADLSEVPEGELVFQSRSGSPHQPWLEPDVCDRIRELVQQGVKHFIVLPLGFVSDHMEVLYDLDTEAAELCQELGVKLTRLPTVGTSPAFIEMLVGLVKERLGMLGKPVGAAVSLGRDGPCHDKCPENCCMPGTAQRPVAASRPA
jgi:ferrochelatase